MESTAPGVYRTFDDLYPIVSTRVRWYYCSSPGWHAP